jgi:hypothetical protein
MTDQELLEFAAKAAGQYHVEWSDKVGALRIREGNRWIEWNPLKNNADAFRLLAALRIDLCFEKLYSVSAWTSTEDRWITEYCDDSTFSDIEEKTRLVIVKAAASIGRE